MSEATDFGVVLLSALASPLPEALAYIVFRYVVVPCPFCGQRIFYVRNGEESMLITCGNCYMGFAGDEHLDPLPDNRVWMDCPMCQYRRVHTIEGDVWDGDRMNFYQYAFDLRCDCEYRYRMVVKPEERLIGGPEGRVALMSICVGCQGINYALAVGVQPRSYAQSLCGMCRS
jgi:ribosomal protein L37AE/L43A